MSRYENRSLGIFKLLPTLWFWVFKKKKKKYEERKVKKDFKKKTKKKLVIKQTHRESCQQGVLCVNP